MKLTKKQFKKGKKYIERISTPIVVKTEAFTNGEIDEMPQSQRIKLWWLQYQYHRGLRTNTDLYKSISNNAATSDISFYWNLLTVKHSIRKLLKQETEKTHLNLLELEEKILKKYFIEIVNRVWKHLRMDSLIETLKEQENLIGKGLDFGTIELGIERIGFVEEVEGKE